MLEKEVVMSTSGLRWADSSSDESESEAEFVQTTQHAGLNDGSIGVFEERVIVSDMGMIKPKAVAGFSSDEESSVQSESSSDADDEGEPTISEEEKKATGSCTSQTKRGRSKEKSSTKTSYEEGETSIES